MHQIVYFGFYQAFPLPLPLPLPLHIYNFFAQCNKIDLNDATCLQDFNVNALEKFVEETSIPLVTLFNKDPNNHPFVIKFFSSPNDNVNSGVILFTLSLY